jgi:hypothetical protein
MVVVREMVEEAYSADPALVQAARLRTLMPLSR